MIQEHSTVRVLCFSTLMSVHSSLHSCLAFYNVLCILMMMGIATYLFALNVNCSPNTEGLNGSWKDGGFTPSSYSSSGYWSWSAPSDQSNPSTPSPPLSADSFKPFRMPSLNGPPDDNIDEHDGNSLLFDEPIPRKRKVSRCHLSFTYGDLILPNLVKRYDWRNRWWKIMDLQLDGKNAADVPLTVFLARLEILEVLMQFGVRRRHFRRALNICHTKALKMFAIWSECVSIKNCDNFSYSAHVSGHFCLLSFNKENRTLSCQLMSDIKSGSKPIYYEKGLLKDPPDTCFMACNTILSSLRYGIFLEVP